MNITVFANCQGAAISCLLEPRLPGVSIRCFTNYSVIAEGATAIDSELDHSIRESDVVIYQPLRSRWGIYSCIENLYGSKLFISFPYIYVDGLWPYYPDGPLLIGHSWLDNVFNECGSQITESIDYVSRLLFSPFSFRAPSRGDSHSSRALALNLETRLNSSLITLRKKEQNTTIAASSTIEVLIKSGICPMYTQNHPSAIVVSSMVDRMLEYIQLHACFNHSFLLDRACHIGTQDDVSLRSSLYGTSLKWPLIPSVADLFGINGCDEDPAAVKTFVDFAERYYKNLDLSSFGVNERGYPLFSP